MAFRLTLILLLVVFGTMYLAPDAPPRADRAASADRADPPPRDAPAAAVTDAPRAAQPQADTALRRDPPPAAPLVPNAADRAPDPSAGATPDRAPAETVAPDALAAAEDDDTGPVVLPDLGLSDPGGDSAGALSLSDAARARAADAASDATTDLLRGLVGDLSPPAPTSPNPPPASPPQPTDPLPPPVGDLARILGTEVNLRAGPSTADAVVGQVTEGQTVRVLTPDRDGWSGIEDPASGEEVFIATRFLDILR